MRTNIATARKQFTRRPFNAAKAAQEQRNAEAFADMVVDGLITVSPCVTIKDGDAFDAMVEARFVARGFDKYIVI